MTRSAADEQSECTICIARERKLVGAGANKTKARGGKAT